MKVLQETGIKRARPDGYFMVRLSSFARAPEKLAEALLVYSPGGFSNHPDNGWRWRGLTCALRSEQSASRQSILHSTELLLKTGMREPDVLSFTGVGTASQVFGCNCRHQRRDGELLLKLMLLRIGKLSKRRLRTRWMPCARRSGS